ncbi:MAG: hypothetical protein M3R04_04780 [bacterium]|nr:hypothetical protein [bacterium]
MRWLTMLMLSALLFGATGCLFTDDDGTPDTVVVDGNDTPDVNTTIIEDNDPPPTDVDVNVTP